jgi:hypothetical protein
MLRKVIISAIFVVGVVLHSGSASAQTAADCDAYARDYANWWTGNPFVGAAAGGAIGAVFGAVAGEIIADRPGLGALIGGGIGARIGRNQTEPEWQAAYTRAYNACLDGTPLPYPGVVAFNWNGGRYPTDDPRWWQYCEDTYGQYWDPWTGMYLASNGQHYPCIVP